MKKKSRILAVDDEEAIAESIAYLLEAPHRTIAVAKFVIRYWNLILAALIKRI